MKNHRVEPEQLRRGRAFQQKFVSDFVEGGPDGAFFAERRVTKRSGRRGRVDLYIVLPGLVTLIELKSTDWDAMELRNVRRNYMRHVNQLWGYIESIQREGFPQGSMALIYERRPRDSRKMDALMAAVAERSDIEPIWIEDLRFESRADLTTNKDKES